MMKEIIPKEPLDYWKLCDRVTIFQAIMLVIGADPQSQVSWEVENNMNKPNGCGATKTALVEAAKEGLLEGEIKEQINRDSDGSEMGTISGSVDIDYSFISVASLKRFLKERNFDTGFFFPQKGNAPDYLDDKHPNYAPKLAAAVEAWQAVTADEQCLNGKTPRQAIEKWLRENASRFGLSDDEGNPNKDGIEQISKVTNWKPEGGAAKTRGNLPTPKKPTK